MPVQHPVINQLDQYLHQHRQQVAVGYIMVLLLVFAAYLCSLALRYSDTDLWYHLTGGRYLLSEGMLYNPFVQSFLTPAREFTNYFWGFQISSYLVWLASGEVGLILAKAALLTLSAYLSIQVVLAGRPFREAHFWHLLIITLIIALLGSRGFSLRPHVFSYVFIPLFSFILIYRPKWYAALPLLTILWVNTHGVEWVVGALLCGSIGLQSLVNWWSQESTERHLDELKPLLWIIACAPAMLVNPNGINVLLTPFSHDPGLWFFIGELQDFTFQPTFEFEHGFSLNTLTICLLAAIVSAGVLCAANWRHHIAAYLLAAGGLVLLMNGQRFVWEWMFLSLPLIGEGFQHLRKSSLSTAKTALLILILGILLQTLQPLVRDGLANYPIDRHSLPHATTSFLKQIEFTGSYAIEPSYAGYVEFELPEAKIFIDMQFPPFHSDDYYQYFAASQTAKGLKEFVANYRPDAIGIMLSNKNFPVEAAATLGYQPVFFDQEIVLFLNESTFSEAVNRYRLSAINPFNSTVLRRQQLEEGISELNRMLAFVDAPDARETLIGLLLENGEIERASTLLVDLLIETPNRVGTIYTSARVAHLQDDCAAAIPSYEKSITLTDEPGPMHRYAAECYFSMGQPHLAYQHFGAAFNPFRDPAPNALNYYQYALSAVSVDDTDLAISLLKMIPQFSPDSQITQNAEALLTKLKEE